MTIFKMNIFTNLLLLLATESMACSSRRGKTILTPSSRTETQIPDIPNLVHLKNDLVPQIPSNVNYKSEQIVILHFLHESFMFLAASDIVLTSQTKWKYFVRLPK